MAASTQRPNEASPLLPSLRPTERSDVGSLDKLRRSRFVLIPLLIVAIVGILWISTSNNADNAVETANTGSGSHLPEGQASPSDNYSDANLLKLSPPFDHKLHIIPPKMINRSAFTQAIPTNAFWTNLLVGDDHGLNVGAGQVTLSPYTVRSLPKRLDISYGDSRRVATNTSITEYFNADVSFTGYSRKIAEDQVGLSRLLGDGNSTSRHVVAFDPLSVTVQYSFDEGDSNGQTPKQYMDTLLVRGSPYVTVDYHEVIPVIEFNATVYSINAVPVQNEDEPTPGRQQWTGKRFEIDIGVYGATNDTVRQKWVLYFAEERTLNLQFANEKDYRAYNLRGELTIPTNVRLVDSDLYTGVARIAIVPDVERDGVLSSLDDHATVYPVGSSVNADVEGDAALVTFCWKVKSVDGAVNPTNPLLMLANPHHVDSFSQNKQTDATFKQLSPFGHRTIKSYMTPVRGNCWTLEEKLPQVGFDTNQTIADQSQVDEIKNSLVLDANYTPVAQDPYFFGKEIGRQARLVLIADTLGEDKIRDELLNKLEEWIQPWLVGENEDPFVYDYAWGGLCSENGLSGIFWMTDFGNGWYNDHHFHYGYFLYSLAVVAKYRPAFAEKHKAAMLSIVRDIANFDSSDNYFPLARHFSWFDGHSFASGVYALDGGKSQESVSEAINAYYGVYLLGKALQIPDIEHIGHLLVALESRAAQTYWQMSSSSQIYEPVYAQNKMTGQIGCTKVSYTTWFGPEMEHMHLINMIPFTPITDAFLSPSYVKEEYPLLQQQAFERAVNPIDDRWKGYAYLDLAIIEPQKAWDLVQTLDFFDDGSSRTNSLYWIATRPTRDT
ncbi:hypothetical protein Poli38472_004323 [Pythium oligandrum]|uniref:glucan endo-1,3-beta-D-glucosidase n=1 Tax=Pythium oligandrum TaxID=41045 RepID=A0A8K1CA32_PYTOL|nr:hypothetical protein Poli38472_004323 [Pythium oligandrum]|eukprot:TMW59254.1 hypothetical protein Poli38472_004323 [Pythium oligandrum]